MSIRTFIGKVIKEMNYRLEANAVRKGEGYSYRLEFCRMTLNVHSDMTSGWAASVLEYSTALPDYQSLIDADEDVPMYQPPENPAEGPPEEGRLFGEGSSSSSSRRSRIGTRLDRIRRISNSQRVAAPHRSPPFYT
ncbi:hypothetical protein TWF694_005317 [Orbilia ellipsospora]|uniref:Uncharacterized protein n=1 Tax=Orbilia ellipsospora TaxID=2528407 RepID=A0AAV9WSR9_9PEZI